LRAPIRVPEEPEGTRKEPGPGEEEDLPAAPAPGEREGAQEGPETTPEGASAEPEGDQASSSAVAGTEGPEGATGGETPLRERVSLWSSIGADTSGAERPDPKDVDLVRPILLFLAPIAFLLVGSFVAREAVWDNFLDPYVWQMIVRDEGFNIYNTSMWALLLGLLLFVAYRLVQKIEQPVDFILIAGTVPYMVGGAIVRVMEDTGYFGEPLRFFFITPIIYVLIFGVAVLWLVLGRLLRAQADKVGPEAAVKSLAGMFGVIWVLYLAVSIFAEEGTVSFFPSPVILFFAFLVPLGYFWMHVRQTGRFSQVGVMAAFGGAFMLSAIYMLILWHSGQTWDPMVPKPVPADPENRFWVYAAMIVSVGLFVGLLYTFALKRAGRFENLFVFLLPINLLVIFGQTWDAVSTSIGVDGLGYEEKHVLPGRLIELLDASTLPLLSAYPASFVMIPLKILVAFLVVYLIDVYSRVDMEKYPDLVGLVKLAIIMVGVVPGTRNMIRMAMGV
jgi:uncharacterized membrane protein